MFFQPMPPSIQDNSRGLYCSRNMLVLKEELSGADAVALVFWCVGFVVVKASDC